MRSSHRIGVVTALVAFLLVFLVAGASPVFAQADFFTSSPGKLSKSHASLEGQEHCNDCHDGGKSVSNAKCLDCHDHGDLKRRIAAGKGFHSSAKVRGRECRLCHQEHRGRGFDLMGWRAVGGMKSFDHALAGWKLRGKHAVLDCTRCHEDRNRQGLRTFLGADRTCGGCHQDDNEHGKLRKALQRCERCHSETAWDPPKRSLDFDHDDKRDADMPLIGTHAQVHCAKCHPKARFVLPDFEKGDCESCHESPHDGHLFSTVACTQCHSPKLRSLSSVRFNHRRRAGLRLVGAHAKTRCTNCHTKRLRKRKPKRACESCHASDSRHGDRFSQFGKPPRCATCHPQSNWSARTFSHGKHTPFALTGKHRRIRCRKCHRGRKPSQFERFDFSKMGCMGCHQHENAHGGKFDTNQCLECHTEGGVKRMKEESLQTFHGPDSRFPLTKKHAEVQCQTCHKDDIYKATPRECGVSCHEDSLHRGTLGDECSRCHEPGAWPASRFDHTEDTEWPLRGKHASIEECESCHPAREYDGTPQNCGDAGCHQKDDVHRGELGSECQTCHREDGALLFEHNRDTEFRIDGAHSLLVCANCHESVEFQGVEKECVGCHPEPAIHRGRYGTRCETCHSTSSFGDIEALHDVGDFSLGGAHDQLACKRCHERGEKRQGSGQLCITCHRRDDIHQNSLSPRCGECHTQRSFAPARFRHASAGCNLLGLHRSLPCADCHTGGNYGAVSPLCVSCHRGDALAVSTPNHEALIECGECHSPSAWRPIRRFGRQTICR